MTAFRQSLRRFGIASLLALLAAGLLLAARGIGTVDAATAGGGMSLRIYQYVSGTPAAVTGDSVRFVVYVENAGSTPATGARLVDALPAGIASFVWNCTPQGMASCASASGSGALDEPLDDLAVGGALEYTIDATVAASPPPFITNVALVTLPAGAVCADGDTPPCRADGTVGTRGLLETGFTAVPKGAQPGGNLAFTVEFRSLLEVPAGAIVRIPLADGLSAMSWSCSAADDAVCPSTSGSGPVEQTVGNWPTGGTLTYTFSATVDASAPLEINQAALAIPPYGGQCGTAAFEPPCTDVARVQLGARIELQMYAEVNEPFIRYTINIANSGSAAGGSVFSNPVPAGVTFDFWNCIESDGAVCPQLEGSGAINATIATLPPGSRLEYVIDAQTVTPAPSTVTNTATLVPPAGGRCEPAATAPPCIASVTTGTTAGGLVVDFAGGTVYAGPGTTATVTFEIANPFGVSADGSTVSVPVPAGIAAFDSWTCTGEGAGCPAASGTGAINLSLGTLPIKSSLRFNIDARVDAAPPPEVIITGSVSPVLGGGFSCEGGNPAPPCQAVQSIMTAPLLVARKSTSSTGIAPGGTIDYQLYIENFGIEAANVRVEDPLPAGVVSATWTCSSGYAACPQPSGVGAIDQTIVSLPQFASILYSITATVDAVPPAAITNTMTVTTGDGARCIAEDESNVPQPCVSSVSNDTQPLIELALTSAQSQAIAGSTMRYTLSVFNRGTATGSVTLDDPLPTGVDSFIWQCRGFAGAICPNDSGTGALAETIGALPAGGRVVYTIDAAIAVAASGTINHTASVTPPAGVACSPVECSVTSTIPVSLVPTASIFISKSASAVQAPPGSALRYLVELRNIGNVTASNVLVSDPLPNGLASMIWTCEGIECPAASGSGSIAETLPLLGIYTGGDGPGGAVVYTIDATVATLPPPMINNVATVTPSGSATCAFGTCTSTASVPTGVAGEAVLAIAFTNVPPTPLLPEQPITYSIQVDNTGNAAAGETTINNPVPAGLEAFSWTCTALGSAKCPALTGTGAITAVLAELADGAGVRFDVSANVAAAPPASIVDTVTVKAPTGAVCNPASCVATLTLPVNLPAAGTLSLSKTADSAMLVPGGQVTYTVTVANPGLVGVGPTLLSDPLPAGLASFAWTCAASGSAVCPLASGTGSISQSFAVPGGSSLVYTVVAQVSANATANVVNSATLTPPAGVTCAEGACSVALALPVASAAIIVDKRAAPAAGTPLSPGQTVTWTLRANNSGSPSTAALTLIDDLPANIGDILVSAGAGTSCNTTTPAPGSQLVCSIDAGFSGERSISVTATVTAADAQGGLRNTLAASGADAPACAPCSTVHPVAGTVDIEVTNLRPFNAAGVAGVLVDIVNPSADAASMLVATVEPASAIELFGVYSGNCTATSGPGGAVVVSCPTPPSSQGIQCSGNQCTIQMLGQNGAATLFIALAAQTSASLRVDVPGDPDPGNNIIVLPAGGNP